MQPIPTDCPFCLDLTDRFLIGTDAVIAVADAFPVTRGHTLVIPRRHVSEFFDLNSEEVSQVHLLSQQLRDRLVSEDPSIEGFTIGWNTGPTAGQTVPHAHQHVIPRRQGDHPDPRGGIRGVLPGAAKYPAAQGAARLRGADVIDFLERNMTMSGRYQPLLLRAIILNGNSLSRAEWGRLVLETEPGLMEWATTKAMRWPKETLVRKRKILDYDSSSKTFVLPVEWANEEERKTALGLCDEALARWRDSQSGVPAPRRYQIIERDGGRCLACGVLGSQHPLDVDHIIPKSRARNGLVERADGTRIPVDHPENLQTLCAQCNREKQALGDYIDFRPSPGRLRASLEQLIAAVGALPDSDARYVLEPVRTAQQTWH